MLLKKKTEDSSHASASVVDGKLILSFPNAATPVVWQMDLEKAKASALEVLTAADSQFSLSLKTPKGEKIEVAVFDSREDAVTGLMAASSALENAHGQIRTLADGQEAGIQRTVNVKSSSSTQTTGSSKTKKVLTALGAFAILFVAFSIWVSSMPRPAQYDSQAAASASGASVQNSAGVPVSADAYLSGQ